MSHLKHIFDGDTQAGHDIVMLLVPFFLMDICQRVGTWVSMVWCVWVLSRSGSFEDSDGEDETR